MFWSIILHIITHDMSGNTTSCALNATAAMSPASSELPAIACVIGSANANPTAAIARRTYTHE